jgi:alkylresorcinol/alkylpyrone synthase
LSFDLLGVGMAVPDHTMSTDEAVTMSTDLICRDRRESRLLSTMFRRSRIKNRHTCLPHRIAYQWVGDDAAPSSNPGPTTFERMQLYVEHAAPLAAIASSKALAASGISGSQITHLVTVSCTGFDAPGVDIHLIDQLGLPRTTQRVNVAYMGCHGAINALRVAAALSADAPEARVLICAVELCSLHYRTQWDEDGILGNALFADGAAAIVGGQSSDSQASLCGLRATGSCLIDDSRDAITWRIGNHGFDMTLSSRVPELIHQQLRPWLSTWLDSLGLAISDVGSWAVHPGGPRILDAVEKSLELHADDLAVSREILEQFGNMSSPTIMFILDRLLTRNAARPCVALGFGPGLMAEAALFQ